MEVLTGHADSRVEPVASVTSAAMTSMSHDLDITGSAAMHSLQSPVVFSHSRSRSLQRFQRN